MLSLPKLGIHLKHFMSGFSLDSGTPEWNALQVENSVTLGL